MQRRSFIKALSGLVPYPVLSHAAPQPTVPPAPVPVTLQESPIVGFQHHQDEAPRPRRRPAVFGSASPRTVTAPAPLSGGRSPLPVYWRDTNLGYVPRNENTAVTQLLDRNRTLIGRIVEFAHGHDPWKRLRFAVALRA